MTLWLVRTGKRGEHEKRFLETQRIYLTWDGLSHDLRTLKDRGELTDLLRQLYPDNPEGKLRKHCGEIWAFVHRMRPKDWVLIASKNNPTINIAEITGSYVFEANAEDPYYHHRGISWLRLDVPRSSFDADLLYSLSVPRTVYQIQAHDGEKRISAMVSEPGKSAPAVDMLSAPRRAEVPDVSQGDFPDLAEAARDQIAKLIIAKFKGHRMAELVNAVLKAQGYTTYVSAPGPDKGVDILAARGALGFGEPRICVQVKSGDTPVDHPTLTQLVGAMQNFSADQGLLVSWSGFKSSVTQERANQFFRVRLWDQNVLVEQLLKHYDDVDPDVRAELPLKRIWVVAESEEGTT